MCGSENGKKHVLTVVDLGLGKKTFLELSAILVKIIGKWDYSDTRYQIPDTRYQIIPKSWVGLLSGV